MLVLNSKHFEFHFINIYGVWEPKNTSILFFPEVIELDVLANDITMKTIRSKDTNREEFIKTSLKKLYFQTPLGFTKTDYTLIFTFLFIKK